MKCHRAQHYMMAYHDGELSAGTKRRVRKHLESCSECARLLEGLRFADRQACSAAGGTEMVNVPGPDNRYWESFTPRVLDRIEEDAATRVPEKEFHRRRWDLMIPRLAPVFSIALVVVVAAGILFKMDGPPNQLKIESIVTGTSQGQNAQATEDQGSESGLKETTPGIDQDRVEDETAGKGVKKPEEETSVPRSEKVTRKAAAPKEPRPIAKKKEKPAKLPETASTAGKQVPAVKPSAVQKPLIRETEEGHTGKVSVVDRKETVPREKALPVVEQSKKGPEPGSPGKGAVDKGQEVSAAAAQEAPAVIAETVTVESGQSPSNAASSSSAVFHSEISPPLTAAGASVSEKPGTNINSAVSPAPGETPVTVGEARPADGTPIAASPSEAGTGSLILGLPPYKSQEDQLVHAQTLADELKFRESEQVLRDIISQSPPPGVLEKASILLVKVLSSQNRTEEAREVLDKAKAQFPSSEMIQTFDLKQAGEGPGN